MGDVFSYLMISCCTGSVLVQRSCGDGAKKKVGGWGGAENKFGHSIFISSPPPNYVY